jgi:hypothetical protein
MYKQKELIMLQTNECSTIHEHPKGLMYQSIEPFIQKNKDLVINSVWVYAEYVYKYNRVVPHCNG